MISEVCKTKILVRCVPAVCTCVNDTLYIGLDLPSDNVLLLVHSIAVSNKAIVESWGYWCSRTVSSVRLPVTHLSGYKLLEHGLGRHADPKQTSRLFINYFFFFYLHVYLVYAGSSRLLILFKSYSFKEVVQNAIFS